MKHIFTLIYPVLSGAVCQALKVPEKSYLLLEAVCTFILVACGVFMDISSATFQLGEVLSYIKFGAPSKQLYQNSEFKASFAASTRLSAHPQEYLCILQHPYDSTLFNTFKIIQFTSTNRLIGTSKFSAVFYGSKSIVRNGVVGPSVCSFFCRSLAVAETALFWTKIQELDLSSTKEYNSTKSFWAHSYPIF